MSEEQRRLGKERIKPTEARPERREGTQKGRLSGHLWKECFQEDGRDTREMPQRGPGR